MLATIRPALSRGLGLVCVLRDGFALPDAPPEEVRQLLVHLCPEVLVMGADLDLATEPPSRALRHGALRSRTSVVRADP
jgi:hypothetical protein